MCQLWINQVVGFYYQMSEKYQWKSDILSKDAGCFYISWTLLENGLSKFM